MKIFPIYLSFLFCTLLSSCNLSSIGTDNEQDAIKIKRYDKLLYDYVTLNKFDALQMMKTDCFFETRMLVEDVLELGTMQDDNIDRDLRNYYSSPLLLHLMSDGLKMYEDMTPIEEDFTKVFERLKKVLPDLPAPVVFSQFSALNQSIVVNNNLVGFSIDKYMGTDYPLYKEYYADYQRRTMNRDYIVNDCMLYYLMSEYPFPWSVRNTLLDHIIFSGRNRLLLVNVLGQSSVAENLGYTKEEEKWCLDNEKKVWAMLCNEGYLYENDPRILRGLIGESTGSILCGDGAPTKLGVWIGSRIVERYMKERNMKWPEIMADDGFHRILNRSGYGI